MIYNRDEEVGTKLQAPPARISRVGGLLWGEGEGKRERESAIVVKIDQDGEEKLMFRFKSVSPRVSFGRRGTNFVLGGLKRLLPRRSWSALYVA